MYKRFLMLSGVMTMLALGAEQTLNLEFDGAKEFKSGNKTIKIDGTFTPDKFLCYGEKGVSIPAENLVGKSGTILFTFKIGAFKEPLLAPRYLMTLRCKSRLTLGIYTFPANPILHFSFTDQAKKYYYRSKDKLVPGRTYQAAITWDNDKFRVYMDGLLAAETEQPLPVDNPMAINIGPYVDGWQRPKPWGNDSFVKSLRVYDHALSGSEIARIGNVKMEKAAKTFPGELVVPARQGGELRQDGVLDENLWRYAASMPYLSHGKHPEKSGEFPPNQFLLTYDKNNLYLGFNTLFPAKSPLKQGALRTAKQEPEVWGDESFEFYIEINKVLYRFAGNVAGGYTEWKGSDARWDGKWSYHTSLKMRIDNTVFWQGEAVIPWKTLGLDAPPAGPVKFNFCRTWRLPETGTHSSLLDGGQYNTVAEYPSMRFQGNVPSGQMIAQSNPALGRLDQTVRFASPGRAEVRYQVRLGRADGSAAPLTLVDKVIRLEKDSPIQERFTAPIASPAYDRLITTLSQGGQVLMQQILPFKLNEEYMSVAKRFLAKKVVFRIKSGQLKGKFGSSFAPVLRVTAPDGRELYRKEASGDAVEVAFPRENQAGAYKAELLDKNGKSIYGVSFDYPGIGEWEKLSFDNRIIPPFTPLRAAVGAEALKGSVWNRTYYWQQSLFPRSIKVGNVELLAAPVMLYANGAVIGGAVRTEKVADHRVDFSGGGNDPAASVKLKGFLEYDGVQYNHVDLTANRDLNNLELVIRLPKELVKYLHTSDTTVSWGAKITDKVGDNDTRKIRFYPTLWLGMEDKGLCFFTETRRSWKSPVKETYTLHTDSKFATLTVHLARVLKKGEKLSFEFGLIASPVRPLSGNYPLNTFSYNFASPMNRPGKAPASWAVIPHGLGDIEGYFCDLPTKETSADLKYLHRQAAVARQFGAKTIPYTCDRYLSEEYPEMAAFKDEWKISPDLTLDYQRNGRKYFLYDCCPRTGANAFFMTKVRNLFKNAKIDGIYFDFGLVPICSNELHGCQERVPLLAQREFYRRVALIQLDAGVKEPVIVLHNTDAVQVPAMTFATHLFNGEHIRQHSSTIMHNGKDILDTYGIEMFASELSSLPFGLTNSVYQANDVLMKQFGGGKEDPELYKFRITQAMLAGTLPHNTIAALNRCHFGIFDKVIRIYDKFGVPQAKFIGYWEKPGSVSGSGDVYVSIYRHAKEKRALAVISHIGKDRAMQRFSVTFDPAKLGFTPGKVVDLLPADDPEYADLAKRLKQYRVSIDRTPLTTGDFGSKLLKVEKGKIHMELKPHTFAIMELAE